MVPSQSRTKRTPRVPYASAADALRIKGARKASGEYRDRRDVEPLPGCECRSYVDILTAGRWRALGFYVRTGEHAHFHGGKQKSIALFCRCQIVSKDTPTDYLVNLAPCAACDEPAELDSNGLCADCASFTAPDPEPASAPVPAATETTSDIDWRVSLRKERSTWHWFTTNPQGGGSGSNICGPKKTALANALRSVPEGAWYSLFVNGVPAGAFLKRAAEAPTAAVAETPAPTAPVVVAETPAQIIDGVPVVRLQLVRDSSMATAPRAITGPTDTVTIFRGFIGDPDREHVVMLAVDTKNQPVGLSTVSIGTLNSSIVGIREIFKTAIMANAAAIILCHNHPSGDPTPSAEDVSITRKVVEAGTLLDIELLDHIVLGAGDAWVSLRERGLGFARA